MGETCKTCRYWHGSVDDVRWSKISFKQCRRYPPTVRRYVDRHDDWGHATFPVTPSGAWCGEHRTSPPDAAITPDAN